MTPPGTTPQAFGGASLPDLLARVEGATELGWALFIDVCNFVLPPMKTNEDVAYKERLIEMVGVEAWESVALALCERVLPGAAVIIGMRQTDATRPWARVGKPQDGADSTAATPAIALLAAMLKALGQSDADTSEGKEIPGCQP